MQQHSPSFLLRNPTRNQMFAFLMCINLYSVISSLLLEKCMHHTSPSIPNPLEVRIWNHSLCCLCSFWGVFLKVHSAWYHVMKCRRCSSTYILWRMNREDWLSIAGWLVGFDLARIGVVCTSNTIPELDMKLPRFIYLFYYEMALMFQWSFSISIFLFQVFLTIKIRVCPCWCSISLAVSW